jgi:hypothetical protein
MIQVIYQVASIMLRVAPGTAEEGVGEEMKTFKSLLRILDSRWRLAGKS